MSPLQWPVTPFGQGFPPGANLYLHHCFQLWVTGGGFWQLTSYIVNEQTDRAIYTTTFAISGDTTGRSCCGYIWRSLALYLLQVQSWRNHYTWKGEALHCVVTFVIIDVRWRWASNHKYTIQASVVQLQARGWHVARQASYLAKIFQQRSPKLFSKVILRHKRFLCCFFKLHGFKLRRKIHITNLLMGLCANRFTLVHSSFKKVWKTSSHLDFLVLHQILLQPNFETVWK